MSVLFPRQHRSLKPCGMLMGEGRTQPQAQLDLHEIQQHETWNSQSPVMCAWCLSRASWHQEPRPGRIRLLAPPVKCSGEKKMHPQTPSASENALGWDRSSMQESGLLMQIDMSFPAPPSRVTSGWTWGQSVQKTGLMTWPSLGFWPL